MPVGTGPAPRRRSTCPTPGTRPTTSSRPRWWTSARGPGVRRCLLSAGRPIGEAAMDLMHRIHADFRYRSGLDHRVHPGRRAARAADRGLSGLHPRDGGRLAQSRSRGAIRERLSRHPARARASNDWSAPTPVTPGSAAGSRAPAGSTSTRPTTGSPTPPTPRSPGAATTPTSPRSRA